MLKPIALATSAALLFTGCHSKSPTWQKVMAAPRATGDAESRDRAYAAELHRQLGSTPHKVVTYEVDHFSKLQGSQTIQRMAVLYFDPANQRQPWWAMDHGLEKPVWVPNDPLPRQVSFLARRPVRIVEVHDYTIARDKVVHRMARDTRPSATTTLQRVEPARGVPVEEARAPKRKWRWFGRPAETKEPAVSRLQPVTETAPPKAKVRQKAPRQEKKTRAPKPATSKKPEKPAEPEDVPKPATPEAKAPARPLTNETPAPPAEAQKKPPLINREDSAPAPAPVVPSNLDDAANEPRRPNLFQRILSTLNPARWFRKAA